MTKALVEVRLKDSVAWIRLSHPEKRNALSLQMLQNISAALYEIEMDKSLKAVVLCSTGKVFSSGHDLQELSQSERKSAKAIFSECTEVMQKIRKFPHPVIACVQGLATAAGCQLALSCDLIVAAEEAAFATPGVKIGLFCSSPAVPLARTFPEKKAMQMLLTGEPVSAREAERLGVVNFVASQDRLEEETSQLAKKIVAFSASTLSSGKRTYYEQTQLSIDDAYSLVEKYMVVNLYSPDAQEGIKAFLEKRSPNWQS
jgi:enoyl-CoA hydratase/carnithine racemase